jgi:hypothetical protein
VLRSGSPRNEGGPVTENSPPIFIGSAAQENPIDMDPDMKMTHKIRIAFLIIDPIMRSLLFLLYIFYQISPTADTSNFSGNNMNFLEWPACPSPKRTAGINRYNNYPGVNSGMRAERSFLPTHSME